MDKYQEKMQGVLDDMVTRICENVERIFRQMVERGFNPEQRLREIASQEKIVSTRDDHEGIPFLYGGLWTNVVGNMMYGLCSSHSEDAVTTAANTALGKFCAVAITKAMEQDEHVRFLVTSIVEGAKKVCPEESAKIERWLNG